MNNNSTKQLAEAFLRWPLPKSVRSDECATVRQEGRIGTNLMTYVEAEKMFTDIVGPTLAENAVLRDALYCIAGNRGEASPVTLTEAQSVARAALARKES